MRRKNFNAGNIIFWLIILSIFSDVIGELIGFGLGLAFLLGPFAVIGIIIKKVIEANKRDYKRYTAKTVYNTNKAKKADTKVDKNAINKKLRKYFENNYKLRLFEEIALTTNKGEYIDFDSLYVSVNDEIICSLKEFGENHPDIYSKILKLLETFAKQKETVAETVKFNPEPEKKIKDANKAQYYIEKINALNNEIPHVEITNSLNQTCDFLRRIDSAAKKEDAKLTKLYEYYLPILVGILENYKNLQMNQDSEDYKKCESQLIKLTIMINDALKAINESIHSEEYMELNADMATLESLLRKDILDDGMGK